MDSIEKVTKNYDVLETIFKYLNLREQLKIANICELFEFIITHLIWRTKCKTIIVMELCSQSVLVKCNKSRIETSMDYNNFETFLKLCSIYLKNLELKFVHSVNPKITYDFVNLTTIVFYKSQVDNKILQEIAKNCLKLTKFHMKYCRNLKREPLKVDKDIKICIFYEMKELNDFKLINHGNNEIDYRVLNKFFKISKLKVLFISSSLKFNKPVGNDENESKTYPIENLSIGCFCDQYSWLKFSSLNFLNQLQNLTKLCINQDPSLNLSIDDTFLQCLAKCCHLLKDLTLERCKLMIKIFPVLSNLSSLSLIWCWGLSGYNLRDIFKTNKIQNLTLINTFCLANFYDLSYTSDTLRTLTIETTMESDLISAFINPCNSFNNIHTISWIQNAPRIYKNNINNLENISTIYPNVQKMLISDYYISVEELKCLKVLNNLELNLLPYMSWLYIKQLLELPYLSSLTIMCKSNTNIQLKPYLNIVENTGQCLTKNLKYLKIPLFLIDLNVEFWLTILLRNTGLMLMGFTTLNDDLNIFTNNYLKRLLDHEKFPSHIYINICDFNIDYRELKADILGTLNRYNFHTNVDGEYYIILKNMK